MPARLAHVRRKEHALTPQLLPLAERLMELEDAHCAAVNGEDEAFYEDGRHEELLKLLPIVHHALGIKLWEDGRAMLRQALAAIQTRECPEWVESGR